jgi:BrnA antitoxin of type II toxin-antitoxin system
VAAHDFADGGGVGWGAGRGGLEDGGDLAEVVGAEKTRGDDGEGFCRGGVEVFEAVDDSARDEDGVAGTTLHGLAVDGVGEDALEAVGGLFVGVVAVGGRDSGSGGDFELEHGDGASGSLGVDEVADGEASDADHFMGGCWHELCWFSFCGLGVRVIVPLVEYGLAGMLGHRLDADVIVWPKKDGKGYQTRANQVLRERILKEMAGRVG